jgi:DNA-binding beta-propeller fold protein YncE
MLSLSPVSAQTIEFVSMFGEFGNQTGQFNRPTAVAVDNLGQIFIAERNNNRFQICDYDGICAQFGRSGSGRGEFGDPQGIEVDSEGRVLVAEGELGSRVQVLDQQGNWIAWVGGSSSSGTGQFRTPAGLTVDSEGRIIVSELDRDRVNICSYEGDCSNFGEPGSDLGMFDFPRGVAVDHQGRIVVADWGNHRIQVCDYQGDCFAFGSFGNEPGQFSSPAGVAIDSQGRIVVADRENHRLQLCTDQGDCEVFGGPGTGPGEFNRPLGIVVDSNDRIVVGERDNHRIQILRITDTGLNDFQINAGLNDAWLNLATQGQGFFITVFEDIQMMFLAWFTYDIERPDESIEAILGDPGHRWITAFGPYEGNTAELDVEITSGGVFDSAVPAVTQESDGTITVEFDGCNAGTVSYDIHSLALIGDVPIQRIANDNVPLCEALLTE